MTSDSGSGDTSCDEASRPRPTHDAYSNDSKVGLDVDPLNLVKSKAVLIPVCKKLIGWVQEETELSSAQSNLDSAKKDVYKRLNPSIATYESELSSAHSENEYVDVCGVTDSDDLSLSAVSKPEQNENSCEVKSTVPLGVGLQLGHSKGKKLRNACPFIGCSLSFSRPWRLEAHIRVHNGERPFKCTVDGCKKDYSNNAHLRRHIARNHSESKSITKYKCPNPNCFMLLSNSTALKRHIERKHTARLRCSVCNLEFSKQSQLKIHMFQHKQNTELPFKCDICDSSFAKRRECARHRLRKHRSYSCNHPDCAQVFPTWSLLLKHLKIEHPAPKYVCAFCSRSFAVKVNLRVHLEIHSEPSERKTYNCEFEGCTNYYYKIQNLTSHIKSNHEGKLFLCTYKGCGRQLRTKQKLKHHTDRHNSSSKKKRTSFRTKKRKDFGEPKRSMTSRLLGVILPPDEEKKLLTTDYSLMLSDSSISEHTSNVFGLLVSDVESLV